MVCVLGGIGAVRVLQGVEALARRWFGARRAPAITAAALLLGLLAGSPTIVAKVDNEARVRGGLEHEAYLWHDLKGLIDEAGGKRARCWPAAGSSAARSRRRWWRTSSASTASRWAGR